MNNFIKQSYAKLKGIKKSTSNTLHVINIRNAFSFKQERLKSEMQRAVHQIEKGLSVENPREGFGYEKISFLIKSLSELTEDSLEAREVINRVCSCIESYFRLYETNGWNGSQIKDLRDKFSCVQVNYKYSPTYGGLLEIERENHDTQDFEVLQEIASSRHSIRDFSGEEVKTSVIKKAVEFAQKAPSACNRQAVRCYIIDKSKFNELGDWLKNIGFFGDYGFDKIILVTGKITGYNQNEGLQHLVSPGIFVGYLVLALEALNIGACVMQRSIDNDAKWVAAREKMHIMEDEQSFCLIGVGQKKETYKVPASKRLPVEVIMREI